MQRSWIAFAIGCATFAAAALFARFVLAPAEATTTTATASESSAEHLGAGGEVVQELLAEMVRLREAIEQRSLLARGSELPLTSRSPSEVPASPTAEASSKGFEERLDRLILVLERHLERAVVTGASRAIREGQEPRPTDVEALRTLFARYPAGDEHDDANDKSATQELFGLEPRDIFRRFGAATSAFTGEGSIQWTYELPAPEGENGRELYVQFADGLVISADID